VVDLQIFKHEQAALETVDSLLPLALLPVQRTEVAQRDSGAQAVPVALVNIVGLLEVYGGMLEIPERLVGYAQVVQDVRAQVARNVRGQQRRKLRDRLPPAPLLRERAGRVEVLPGSFLECNRQGKCSKSFKSLCLPLAFLLIFKCSWLMI